MKNLQIPENTSSTSTSAPMRGDSGKLLSLLALATGAAAMPQSGRAEIIYRDLSAEGPPTVGYSSVNISSYTFDDLPGTTQFGFQRTQRTYYTSFSVLTVKYRFVTAGWLGSGAQAAVRGNNGDGMASVLPPGATWSAGPGSLFLSAGMGYGGEYRHDPSSGYSHQYLAWAFSDTTQGGALLYGWIDVSLFILNYPTGPNVTINGYAYDNTPGAKPYMGQMPVPEPSSSGLLILGALALGSRGLRKWRETRSRASND